MNRTYIPENNIFILLIIAGSLLFPSSILFFSGGNVDLLSGIVAVIEGKSLYITGNSAFMKLQPEHPNYAYLPIFALFHSIFFYPAYLFFEYFPLTRNIRWFVGVSVMSFWSCVSYLILAYLSGKLYKKSRNQTQATVLLLAFPGLIYGVILSSSNILVLTLAISGIYAVNKNKWISAGVLIGLSTFKFTGVPFAIVLLGYAFLQGGLDTANKVTVGGIVSQIPNLIWWALHPNDILLLIKNRGGMSVHSYEVTSDQLFLYPIRLFELSQLYSNYIFYIIIIVFSIIGIILAQQSDVGLLLGFPIGYLSTSLLIPAEARIMPLGVFTVLLLIPYTNKTLSIVMIYLIYITSLNRWLVSHISAVGLNTIVNTLDIRITFLLLQVIYLAGLLLSVKYCLFQTET